MLAKELSARGAIPVVLPLVSFADPEDFAPFDRAIAEIEQFDWIVLTSAQAVRAVVKRGEELERSLIRSGSKLRIASVGPVTAEAARQAGLPVEYVAETHTGAALAEELGDRLQGARVFLPRSDRANPDLPAALKRSGAQVIEVIAYRTLKPTDVDQRNLRQTGAGICSVTPVGVSWPVRKSIEKMTTLSVRWFATSRKRPAGSSVKLRGQLPCVETCWTSVSLPVRGSMSNTTMLSCPRFEP